MNGPEIYKILLWAACATAIRHYYEENEITQLKSRMKGESTNTKSMEVLERIRNNLRKREEVLSLRGLGITELPPALTEALHLKELDLSDNKIDKFPQCILHMLELKVLHLENNSIQQIPSSISKLKNLTYLQLSNNRIEKLPRELKGLTNLHHLYLSDNLIREVPKEITNLLKLKALWLNGNKLETLPSGFSDLVEIIESAEPELAIREFKPVRLENNCFNIPNEIFLQSASSVSRYIESIRSSETVNLREAKVILLGEPRAGKTALIERLNHGTFRGSGDTTLTKGIQITNLDLVTPDGNSIKANVWDFGGQELMRSMHQFFMTERSLYILVWDARTDDNHGLLEDWIELILAFGKSSPIFIVTNKTDDGFFRPDEGALNSKYGAVIRGFFRVSCFNGDGFDKLVPALGRALISMEHMNNRIPKSWLQIRNAVFDSSKNCLQLSEFYAICDRYFVRHDQVRHSLLRLLHDLGVAFNYGKLENPDTVSVLKPEWLTAGIYRIILDDGLFGFDGKISKTELERIFRGDSDYPPELHDVILDLMQKFELAFKLPDGRYLVPDLLPSRIPDIDVEDYLNGIRVKYCYKFLPKSIFPKFVVRMHLAGLTGAFWISGASVFGFSGRSNRGEKALIQVDMRGRQINVSTLDTAEGWDLLDEIRRVFDGIHFGIETLKVEFFIALKYNETVFEEFNHLLVLLELGVEEFVPRGYYKKVKVIDFIGNVRWSNERSKDLSDRELYEKVAIVFEDLASRKRSLDLRALKVVRSVQRLSLSISVLAGCAGGFLAVRYWDQIEGPLTIFLLVLSLVLSFWGFSSVREFFRNWASRRTADLYALSGFNLKTYVQVQEEYFERMEKVDPTKFHELSSEVFLSRGR